LRILGVDCGLCGGAAVIDTVAPHLVDAIDLPVYGVGAKRRIDAIMFANWIRVHEPAIAYVERSGAWPHQGNASAFIYGRATGALETVVQLTGVELHIVEAATWKRAFGLRGGDKEACRLAVLAIFPASAHLFGRKRDHNRAEATLLAAFGCDQLLLGVAPLRSTIDLGQVAAVSTRGSNPPRVGCMK